ncbi:hypothetical protein I545_6915 [Mycobacterium kansasii 662]|uniref:Uncharacterized protein n=1 Tax=Mycobacterium kansasii 662 TaxID=1299326 RepID=X7XR35_MYCKA|nr:hypothetical protein I545_6915 [Mycobacterium kansasii 662]
MAMIATHYQIDFSEHYLAEYMATRASHFWAGTPGFAVSESNFLLDPRHWSTSASGCAGCARSRTWKR